MAIRKIKLTGIADGDLLKYNASTGTFVKLTPPVVVAVAAAAASAPTQAEFNALRTTVSGLQAALLAAGLMKAS